MHKSVISFLVLIYFSNILFAQTDNSISGKSAKNSLSGKVTDAKNNAPLPGATVYLNDLKMGVATGSDGKYTLNNIPAGKAPGGGILCWLWHTFGVRGCEGRS
jgi:hypothetical protein